MGVIWGKERKRRIKSIPVDEVKTHHCRCDGNGLVLLHEGRSAGLLIECATSRIKSGGSVGGVNADAKGRSPIVGCGLPSVDDV